MLSRVKKENNRVLENSRTEEKFYSQLPVAYDLECNKKVVGFSDAVLTAHRSRREVLPLLVLYLLLLLQPGMGLAVRQGANTSEQDKYSSQVLATILCDLKSNKKVV